MPSVIGLVHGDGSLCTGDGQACKKQEHFMSQGIEEASYKALVNTCTSEVVSGLLQVSSALKALAELESDMRIAKVFDSCAVITFTLREIFSGVHQARNIPEHTKLMMLTALDRLSGMLNLLGPNKSE